MTARIISTLAVAITIGPSLAYGSPACMTQSEARAKFPKATHLYMRKNCWSDSATNTVQAHSAAAMPLFAATAAMRRGARAFAATGVRGSARGFAATRTR